MEYKLAKQLKDLGFPQSRIPTIYSPEVENDSRGVTMEELENVKAYVPSLDELIIECGTNFGSLVLFNAGGFIMWGARNAMYKCANGNDDTYIGKTPLESVAHLWLALNATRSTTESAANVKTTGE